jgi:RimJ/RimL family protein N-acetyltransferase
MKRVDWRSPPAQALLVDFCFAHTTTNRVEAHTDVENVAEQRALEAAGFLREGRIRGAQWRDGAYRDGFLYAVLPGDHRPKRRRRQARTA